MTAYVPLNARDIAAIRAARNTHLRAANFGDHDAYRECIRLDEIIDAYDDLSRDGVAAWVADMRAMWLQVAEKGAS